MSRKIYERYFGANTDVSRGEGSLITLEAGETSVVVEVEFPPEALIKKLVVVKILGATEFTVDLFNRKSVIGEANEAVAKVIETLSDTNGTVAVFINNDGYAFRNMEGTFTVPVRKIYLRIAIPIALIGDATFEASIAGEPSQGL